MYLVDIFGYLFHLCFADHESLYMLHEQGWKNYTKRKFSRVCTYSFVCKYHLKLISCTSTVYNIYSQLVLSW